MEKRILVEWRKISKCYKNSVHQRSKFGMVEYDVKSVFDKLISNIDEFFSKKWSDILGRKMGKKAYFLTIS